MQLRQTLEWVLYKVMSADLRGACLPSQDGALQWLLSSPLCNANIPLLDIAFPIAPGEPLVVTFHLVLPMGWTESPPYFCMATEMIVDLANDLTHSGWDPPMNPLELNGPTTRLSWPWAQTHMALAPWVPCSPYILGLAALLVQPTLLCQHFH